MRDGDKIITDWSIPHCNFHIVLQRDRSIPHELYINVYEQLGERDYEHIYRQTIRVELSGEYLLEITLQVRILHTLLSLNIADIHKFSSLCDFAASTEQFYQNHLDSTGQRRRRTRCTFLSKEYFGHDDPGYEADDESEPSTSDKKRQKLKHRPPIGRSQSIFLQINLTLVL